MTVGDIYSSVQSLSSAGLHTNVISVCSLLGVGKGQGQAVPEHTHQALLQLLANSLMQTQQWRRAEQVITRALSGVRHSPGKDGCGGVEAELKLQLHSCLLHLGQSTQALQVLQSIPARARSEAVNMAMARLCHQLGMEIPAKAAYREVLKEQPLALEAVKALLQLGLKVREVLDAGGSGMGELVAQQPWLGEWMEGQAALYRGEYTRAVTVLKGLEAGTEELRCCSQVLVDQGLAHYWSGDREQAISVLNRAQQLDGSILRGMDSLAALLAQGGTQGGDTNSSLIKLEQLATRLMQVAEDAPESLVALGHHCHAAKKSSRAVYFAHKACLLDTRNVEALLLKGSVLLELKKISEALNHFREALMLAGHRYEAHCGIVECYLGLGRQKEAVTAATAAVKALNSSPRALTLYAQVLLKEPLSVARAKTFLSKAASFGHQPAVLLLVELLEREGGQGQAEALKLVRQQLELGTSPALHQLAGDLLERWPGGGREQEAMEHYSRAIRMDPNNEALTLPWLPKYLRSSPAVAVEADNILRLPEAPQT